MPKSDNFQLIFRYSKDDTYVKNYIEGLKKKLKFKNRNIALTILCQEHGQLKELQEKILKQSKTMLGQTSSETLIPEGCRSCPLAGLVIEMKGQPMMVCILRDENKQPSIKCQPLYLAQVCCRKPIHISKPTQRKYESSIETLNIQLEGEKEKVTRLEKKETYYDKLRKTIIQKDQDNKTLESYEKDLEKKLREVNRKLNQIEKPMQDLYAERAELKVGLGNMQNVLLTKNTEIATLTTDNEQLREQVQKLSENTLLNENDSLRVQLIGRDTQIKEQNDEIQKLEALRDKKEMILKDILSRTGKMLREFKQYAPASLEPYELTAYLKNVRKTIENFEGYLNTISV